jgi:high-affinity nickel-transport protein
LAFHAILGAVDILVWGLCLTASHARPVLPGVAILAYMFGPRHDADHIAAIDKVARSSANDATGLWKRC